MTELFPETPLWIARLLCGGFFAVLFIQSGLDKVFDFKGNLEWLTGHFSKSILNGTVPLFLRLITLLELAGGFASLAGLAFILLKNDSQIAFWANVICGADLLMLFAGQRIAKDYVGAAGIVPYFIAALLGLFIQA